MERDPVSLKTGIFTLEVILDLFVYGLWIGALCLAAFTLVLFGFGDGNLGEGCNTTNPGPCATVFRARATTFACMTWLSLLLAWTVLDPRRSFFRMKPTNRYFTQWIHDVWSNQFLFWSVIAGVVTIFPILYIPVLNTNVFLHAGIGFEWSIVFIVAILFVLGAETWKYAKRVYFRRRSANAGIAPRQDLEDKAFGDYMKHYDTQEKSDGEDVNEKQMSKV